MSTYFILANWTEQGIKAVKASPKRLRAAKRLAKDCGVKFRSFHMTLGQYDIIVSVEAPDDEAVARFALALGSAASSPSSPARSRPCVVRSIFSANLKLIMSIYPKTGACAFA